jgi:uncharacterized protein
MMEEAFKFLDKIFNHLSENEVELNDWLIDHLCYRTSSIENYKQMKEKLKVYGDCLIESEVQGRPIATYKLFKPINYKGYIIELIEIPAPKAGKNTKEGFEHIEVVVDVSFEELIKKYDHLSLEKKGLAKKINPDLEIEFDSCAIKFHHQSLEDVIAFEQNLKKGQNS